MSSNALYTLLAAVAVFYAFSRWQKRSRNPKGLPLPPGPKPHFLFGNLRDVPKGGYEWLGYERLAKAFGSSIIYLNVFGSHILNINSIQAANDLLDKRSAVFSDRPRLPRQKELTGWDWSLVVMSYSEGFAAHRRLVQQSFQPSVVASAHRPVMRREVAGLLHNLLDTPNDFVEHLRRMAGGIIMMVTYGYQVAPQKDKYVELIEGVRAHGEKNPGSALVDLFPALKYIPAWFPGAGFKREALVLKQLALVMREAPFQMTKERLAAGTMDHPSMVSALLEEKTDTGKSLDDNLIKNCAGVVYSAGADTTVTALLDFILAMMLYPAVQELAHQELDSVIGRDRLPVFDDRERLPYLASVAKEVLRWKAVAPLGVPHSTTADEEYNGMYIPKATTVIANISAMLHDEAQYKDPETFDPERYHPADGSAAAPDPARVAYGFGRRICPGRHFAGDSMWLAMVSILQVFRIDKALDASGRPIEPNVTWASGLVSTPSPFECKIAPRFEGSEHLVAEAEG